MSRASFVIIADGRVCYEGYRHFDCWPMGRNSFGEKVLLSMEGMNLNSLKREALKLRTVPVSYAETVLDKEDDDVFYNYSYFGEVPATIMNAVYNGMHPDLPNAYCVPPEYRGLYKEERLFDFMYKVDLDTMKFSVKDSHGNEYARTLHNIPDRSIYRRDTGEIFNNH